MTPVLTPVPAYDLDRHDLVKPYSIITLQTTGENRSISNEAPGREKWSKLDNADPASPADSALHLLMVAVEHSLQTSKNSSAQSSWFLRTTRKGVFIPDDCMLNSSNTNECQVSVIQFLLKLIQEKNGSDLAMLQERDIFLEKLPAEYTDYKACATLTGTSYTRCELRIALDRVLWKGEYAETVMVSGKDIASMMATAATENTQEQTLQQADISGKWLVTFGIVAAPAINLTRTQVSSEEFSAASDPSCNDAQEIAHPSAGGNTLYCVNGLPLLADHAYSIATTDYMEQNVVPKQPDDYYSRSSRFLTDILEAQIFDGLSARQQTSRAKAASNDLLSQDSQKSAQKSNRQKSGESSLSASQKFEVDYQQRPLFQVQIAKAVAGYNFRSSPKATTSLLQPFRAQPIPGRAVRHNLSLTLKPKNAVFCG